MESYIVVDRDNAPLGMILTTAPVSVCTGVGVANHYRSQVEVIVEVKQIVILNLGSKDLS